MARLTIYSGQIIKKARHYLKNYESSYQHPFPSLVGLARVLNISTTTLKRWRNEVDKQELKATLEKIKDEQHLQLLHKGIEGKFNAAITKLALHNFNYSDKQKVETSDNKVTTVYLTTHFGKPMDLEGLTDEEVIKLARKENKQAREDYKPDLL